MNLRMKNLNYRSLISEGSNSSFSLDRKNGLIETEVYSQMDQIRIGVCC